MRRSSRSRSTTCSAGIFFSSGSATTIAASTPASSRLALVVELHRAGAIEERVALVHEGRFGDVQLDAHRVGARLRRGIADRRAVRHRAGLLDRAGAGEDFFEKAGLAAGERADDRNAPGARLASIVGHVSSLPRTRGSWHAPDCGPAGRERQFETSARPAAGRRKVRHERRARHSSRLLIVSGGRWFGKSVASRSGGVFPIASIPRELQRVVTINAAG